MKLSKIVSLLLCTALLCVSFAACSDGTPSDTPDSISETEAQSTAPEESETRYLDSLPANDYDGRDYNIICRDDKIYEIWTESESGETINDVVFRRNKAVEEKYDVVIKSVPYKGGWDDQSTFKNAISNTVKSNDGAFDLVAGYLAYCSTLGMEGMFYNLYSIPTIDPSNPWWTEGFVENNTIENCLYFTVGDISLTMWEGIYAIYFNKSLAQNNNIPSLYQTVNDHKWTLDYFESLVKSISGDTDGDSQYTADDLFGYVTNRHSLRALITTCNIPIATRNDEGTYDLVYYSDKLVALYERCYDFIYNGNNVYFSKPTTGDWDYTEMMKIFLDDRALFISGTLDNTTTLRQMDTDFGILPFPLYDENQESYISHSYDGLSIFAIPASVKDPECSAMILEALCAESSQSVIPAFYETVLMGKVTRDNESDAMLDIIRDGLFFDFGFVHAVSTNGLFQYFGDKLADKVQNIASAYEKQSKAFNNAFNKVIEAYIKIDN